MGDAVAANVRGLLSTGSCVQATLEKPMRNDTFKDEIRELDVATLFMHSEVGFGREQAVQTQRQCEELAMFAVLSRLDVHVWRDLVVDLWEELKDDADSALRTKKPFVFGLEMSAAGTSALVDMLTTIRSVSPTYEDILKHVASVPGESVDNGAYHVPIRLVLDFRWAERAPDERLTDELRSILDVVQTTKARTSTDSTCIFRINEVSIDCKFELVATDEALAMMKQLLACGVRIRDLPSIKITNRCSLLDTAHHLLPPHNSPHASQGISTLVVSDTSSLEGCGL